MTEQKRKKSTIISENSNKPKTAKENHYVDNGDLYDLLVERKKNGPTRSGDNKIGEALMDIATNLSMKHQFRNYLYREDMVQEGLVFCFRYLDNFDPDKGKNPFAYFTQVCYYAFIGIISKEKKALYVKYKSSIEAVSRGELAEISNGESGAIDNFLDNIDVAQEYMEDYIKDYEDRNLTKKEPKKPVKKTQESTISLFFEDEDENSETAESK